MLPFYIASWVAQVLVGLLSNALSSRINPAVTSELQAKKGPWRSNTDPLMLYPLVGAPLLNAIALHQLHAALHMPSVSGSARNGCALAACLWAVGPLHGLLVNFTSLKVSALVTVHFALTTLAMALVNGALFAHFT
jgi:hypothetical protein